MRNFWSAWACATGGGIGWQKCRLVVWKPVLCLMNLHNFLLCPVLVTFQREDAFYSGFRAWNLQRLLQYHWHVLGWWSVAHRIATFPYFSSSVFSPRGPWTWDLRQAMPKRFSFWSTRVHGLVLTPKCREPHELQAGEWSSVWWPSFLDSG